MKLFISHAIADRYLAQALRLRLEEVSDELHCFLLADDVYAGDLWEGRIRSAAADCDAILSLVSREYAKRPWFIVEWAVFWFQNKPWYLMLEDVDLDGVFEPMRSRQVAHLKDRHEIESFLRGLPVDSSSGRPLDLVAAELVSALDDARRRQQRLNLEANLTRFAASLPKGPPNVSRKVVEDVVEAGGLSKAMELASRSTNSVSLRQFASELLELGQVDAALQVALWVPNLSERASVAQQGMDALVRDSDDSDALHLVLAVHASVRDPQRRVLREAAERRGLQIAWPELPPSP